MPCGARCVRNILVDMGAIVALIRKRDPAHERVVALLASLRGTDQLITTWPVVTECAFVLELHRTAFFDWLFESRVEVVDFDLQAVHSMLEWMKGYRDRQIDFADATLVWLAAERNTDLIVTTDYRDFRTYRLPNRRSFHLLLPEA
jgi:predicted nucleic acid-binding protein